MEMEDQVKGVRPLLEMIANSQNVVMLTMFISFMDEQQIEVLANAALESKRQQKFYKIVVAKLFMAKYLNKVDRSIFFLFYQHPDFKTIETNTTNSLAANIYPYLINAFHRFQHTLSLFRTHTLFLQHHQQLYNFISNLFFNPDLPLPKMKRETIAMYAETPLQQYLAMLKFQDEEFSDGWVQEPLDKLRDKIEQQVVEKQGMEWMEQERVKMETMIYRGYLVGSSSSLQDYLLQGFRTHNLVVLLLGLCSQVAHTYLTVLASIDDPMMRFTEFILRATLYRNIVLALQENLSFVNKAYSSIFQNIYHPPPLIPLFSFHRAALSMWIQGAEIQHKKNERIYCYIISKLRQNNIKNRIQQRSQKLPSFYAQLKDAFEFQEYSQQSKEAAYKENGNQLELQGFLQDNLEMYEILAKDYQQYFLDISINQFNVHWCGHSRQKIESEHYAAFTKLLVDQSLRFYHFLWSKINHSFPNGLKLTVFRQLLRQDLNFQQKFINPLILRQIIEALNEEIKLILSEVEEKVIFGEQGLTKYLIIWDFSEKDDLIAYFASKADISENCPPQLSFFYNLQDDPTLLPPKIIQSQVQNSIESQELEAEIYESEEEI